MGAPAKYASIIANNLCPGIGRLSDLVIERGVGSYVFDVKGDKYLDYSCGIGVTNLGHAHPQITAAVTEQVSKISHFQVNIGCHRTGLEYIERLTKVTPAGMDNIFLWNSGAEAVEAAIKVARMATRKPNIIAFSCGYHGRTYGSMPLTYGTKFRQHFGPFMPGVSIVPFPHCLDCSGKPADGGCCGMSMKELEFLVSTTSSPAETAAIILEPIQGEGGFRVPPPGFMRALKQFCEAKGILLIADEVQSGFGRTGTMFAIEQLDNIVPDILIMAKGIANGLPLSAIAATKELMSKMPPGSMGGTYAGNVVACAAATAVLDVFEKDNVLAVARERGTLLESKLRDLKARYPIRDVRGRGLMLAVEFTGPAGTAGKVVQECLRNGLILLTCGMKETIRFLPPLNTSSSEMDEALGIFEKAVATTFASS